MVHGKGGLKPVRPRRDRRFLLIEEASFHSLNKPWIKDGLSTKRRFGDRSRRAAFHD